MAINTSSDRNQQLDRRQARIAASASIFLALAGCGAMVVLWSTVKNTASVTPLLPAYGAAAIFVLAASIQLLRGQTWPQRALLAFWLIVAAAAAVATLGLFLHGLPSWLAFGETFDKLLKGAYRTTASVASVATLAASLGVSVLLITAAARDSRLRYASYVLVSIVLAVAAVVVINFISISEPDANWRTSMEVLNRYGLSDRTKRILDGVETNVRLTCVYTSTDEKKKASEYRPRVMELLDEIGEYNPNIEVSNVTGEAGRDKLTQHIYGQLRKKARKHASLLDDFQVRSRKLSAAAGRESEAWSKLPQDAYLSLWDIPLDVLGRLDKIAKDASRVAREVRRKMAGESPPDYQALIDELAESLKDNQELLEQARIYIKQRANIPSAVAANRKKALQSADDWLAAANATIEAIGRPKDPLPKDPAAVIKKFAAASAKALTQTQKTARVLDGVAGKGNAPYFHTSRCWTVNREPIPRFFNNIATMFYRNKLDAEQLAVAFAKTLTPEAQLRVIENLRKNMVSVGAIFRVTRVSIETALTKLSTVDDASTKIFKLAEDGKLFDEPLSIIRDVLDRAENLPQIDFGTLASDIEAENIVIVEAGGEIEVVGFEEVWPLKVRLGPLENSKDAGKREFDGDSAIGSRILHMTQKDFATVYLTYFRPHVPPQMANMVPRADLDPRDLNTIRKRLEQANFEVREWNLAEGSSPGGEDGGNDPADRQAKLLLIVPPPPPQLPNPYSRQPSIPSLGEEEVKMLRREIDSGTPAIFLAHFPWPRRAHMFAPVIQPAYPLGGYLRDEWGIDVKSDYRVFSGVPDETEPGRFRISQHELQYLPLSTFTDHPIGKPLQGRRMLWYNLCPVASAAKLPEGVSIRPLLTVGAERRNIWATSRIAELILSIQSEEGSLVSPDYTAGDVPVPFDVAVAARRDGNAERKTKPTRIVVLSVALSLSDAYLTSRVFEMAPRGGVSFSDPPRANADLVTNSAYWLIGADRYIAAGPITSKPIKMMSDGTLWTVRAIVLVGLPLVIVALGGVIMFLRKR